MCARRLASAVLLCATLPSQLSAQTFLQVLELRPGSKLSPGDVVTITFDRPVVGTLDQTFDAARVIRIEPNVAARVDWRDPSTIRIVPQAAWSPGSDHVLTIDTAFRAMDGTRLRAPVRYQLHVAGPRLLQAWPRVYSVPPGIGVEPDGRIRMLFSAPVDPALLERTLRIKLRREAPCEIGGTRSYRVASVPSWRPIRPAPRS